MEHKRDEVQEEGYAERQANRDAATLKAEESGECSGGAASFGRGALTRAAEAVGTLQAAAACRGRQQARPPTCAGLPPLLAARPAALCLPAALYARRAMEQAAALREQKRQEQQRLKKDKQFSWNQKVGSSRVQQNQLSWRASRRG